MARGAPIQLCGWCQGAAESTDPISDHRRCRSTEESPCACALVDHVITKPLAERMAVFCHKTPEWVIKRHKDAGHSSINASRPSRVGSDVHVRDDLL